jgi:hypothetical protein
VVGTTVAERVAYLPSLGVCMAFALVLVSPLSSAAEVCDGGDEGSEVFTGAVGESGVVSDASAAEGQHLPEKDSSQAPPIPEVLPVTQEVDGSRRAAADVTTMNGEHAEPLACAGAASTASSGPATVPATAGPAPIQPRATAPIQPRATAGPSWAWWVRLLAFLALLAAFSVKCFSRNMEWTSQRSLWGSAYAVNPGSAHTCQNYAVNLMGGAKAGDLELAAKVLDSVRSFKEVDRVDCDEVQSLG